MSTQSVTMTEFKHNLGEFVNQVAYSDHRVLLMSHGKARAALIGLEDLERLEAAENQRTSQQDQQLALLAEARAWREQLRRAGTTTDSVEVLQEVRMERDDDLLGVR